jgi:hypothetical protein
MPEPCRDACRLEGEPLAGTAGSARALVAIAWPKPRWHHDEALLSEGLPAELPEVAARAARSSGKVTFRVFQRGPRPSTQSVEVIVWTPRDGRLARAADLPLERVAAFVDDALSGRAPATALAPLLLVCTDGKHDRCCATLGRGMFDAIAREVAAQGSPFELAESSHLGGHRFAATCLALPSGLVHGRLAPADAPALVRALAAGRPWVARFRGRFGLSEPEQVAEAWGYARFPRAERLDVTVQQEGPEADTARVSILAHVAGVQRELSIHLAQRGFASATSCEEAEPRSRKRWTAVREGEATIAAHLARAFATP